MRVLGVDPGLARTGIAIVEGKPGALELRHLDCLETFPPSKDADRLAALQKLFDGVLRDWKPDICAVEQLFFNNNRTTGLRVSEARGIVLAASAGNGTAVIEYTPTEIKSAVAGYGGADKGQVMRMCASMLQMDRIDAVDDAVDACAVAICHHHRAGIRAAGVALRGARMAPQLEIAIAAAREREKRVRK